MDLIHAITNEKKLVRKTKSGEKKKIKGQLLCILEPLNFSLKSGSPERLHIYAFALFCFQPRAMQRFLGSVVTPLQGSTRCLAHLHEGDQSAAARTGDFFPDLISFLHQPPVGYRRTPGNNDLSRDAYDFQICCTDSILCSQTEITRAAQTHINPCGHPSR